MLVSTHNAPGTHETPPPTGTMDQFAKAAWDLLFQDVGSEEETFVSYDDFTVQERAMDTHTLNDHRKYSKERYHNPVPLEKVEEYVESRSPEDYEYKRQPKPAYQRTDTDRQHSGRAGSRIYDLNHKSQPQTYDRRYQQRIPDETSHSTGRSKSSSKKSRKARSKAPTRGRIEQERERHGVRESRRYDDYEYDMETRESLASLPFQERPLTKTYPKQRNKQSLSTAQVPHDSEREHRRCTGRSSRLYNDLEYMEEPQDLPLMHRRNSKSTKGSNSCACPHCGNPSIKSSKRDMFATVSRLPSAKGLFGKR